MSKESVGDRLKALRTSANLTQPQVAAALQSSRSSDSQVSLSTVSRWERGASTPDPDSLTQLATLFKTTTDYILNGERETRTERERPVPPAVEDAINELGDRIDDDVRNQLRATNWHASAVTPGTVRSYALDLVLAKRGARGTEPVKPPPRRAGRRTLKK